MLTGGSPSVENALNRFPENVGVCAIILPFLRAPSREESSGPLVSLPIGAGGNERQKRPRLWYIFCPIGDGLITSSTEITSLLKAWSGGDQAALGRLAEQAYPELRRMARRYMRNESQDTLQPTALVHEFYVRLLDVTQVEWQSGRSFLRWPHR